MKFIPRIRGRVGQGEDNKYYFEISVWNLAATECYFKHDFGPWETENKAHDEMRVATQLVSEAFEKEEYGEVSGQYIDMKAGGVLKPWMQQ